MRLYLVGGFLGSGKTTAIMGAARLLMAEGRRVGVITNDQGKYLVDTQFFAAASVPAVEVTGGCFCCNYDDLDARLDELLATARPDVVFAESVGSCADVVATVVKPLQQLRMTAAGFSVFADARLLLHRLRDDALPFADEVVYIFDKQIEETDLLVINKADLLPPAALEEVVSLARDRYPGKIVHAQSALLPGDIQTWLDLAETAPGAALKDLDYLRYGAGEAALAWLDEHIEIAVPPATGRLVVEKFVRVLLGDLKARSAPIGHIKLLVDDGTKTAKLSVTTDSAEDWANALPDFAGSTLAIALNARVETGADTLRRCVADALHSAVGAGGTFAETRVQAFHPSMPRPTHRL